MTTEPAFLFPEPELVETIRAGDFTNVHDLLESLTKEVA